MSGNVQSSSVLQQQHRCQYKPDSLTAHNEALLMWTIKHHGEFFCSNNSTSHTKISQRETRLIISYPQKLLAGFFLVILCLSQQRRLTNH